MLVRYEFLFILLFNLINRLCVNTIFKLLQVCFNFTFQVINLTSSMYYIMHQERGKKREEVEKDDVYLNLSPLLLCNSASIVNLHLQA